MKVKELAQTVEICTPNSSIKETAGIMKHHDLDAIPIVDEEGEILGVVTQNAVCEAVAAIDRKTSLIKNSEVLLEEILICEPDEKFDKVLKKLAKNRLKFAGFSSQKDNSIAIISLPKILSRTAIDKKLLKKVFRAMEKINKPLPLVLSEVG